MTDRCEPPEHLRGRDGQHWLNGGGEDFSADWNAHVGGWWAFDNHLRGHNAAEAASMGYCYVAPVATPEEVAALRAERDALLAEKTAYESPAWEANERLNEEAFQRDDEIATLRARVETLEAAVRIAEATFISYAVLHEAKMTPEADRKARSNRGLEQAMRAALEEKP